MWQHGELRSQTHSCFKYGNMEKLPARWQRGRRVWRRSGIGFEDTGSGELQGRKEWAGERTDLGFSGSQTETPPCPSGRFLLGEDCIAYPPSLLLALGLGSLGQWLTQGMTLLLHANFPFKKAEALCGRARESLCGQLGLQHCPHVFCA